MSAVNIDQYTRSVATGGTGGSSKEQAAANLGLVTTASADRPLGYITLDAMQEPDPSYIQERLPIVLVSLKGPTYVMIDERAEYMIVNFDAFTGYTLKAITGSVERNGKFITYTAPTTVGKSGFIVNGNRFDIDILETAIQPPSFITPIADSLNNSPRITLTTTPFVSFGITDTHVSTDMEVSTVPDFSIVDFHFVDDTTNLTSFDLDLATNTTYYARVRYHGALLGPSRWSDAVKFKTSVNRYRFTQLLNLLQEGEGSRGQTEMRFGGSVAMTPDGSVLVVGSDYYSGFTENQGCAVIYMNVDGEFVNVQELDIPTPTINARFGFKVAISDDGTRIAISACKDKVGTTPGAGAVYIYRKVTSDSWTLEQRLTPSVLTVQGTFGFSIDLDADGSTLVVGATVYGNAAGDTQVGRCFFFTRAGTSWTEHSTTQSPFMEASELFGCSVSLSRNGKLCLIGASGKRAAYLYQRVGENFYFRSVVDEPFSCESFGRVVKLSPNGDFAAISGFNFAGAADKRGVVYIMRTATDNNGDVTLDALKTFVVAPGIITAGDQFGSCLTFIDKGTQLVVGSEFDDLGGFTNCGSFYILEKTPADDAAFYLKSKCAMTAKQNGGRLGSSAAVSDDGGILAVGAVAFGSSGPVTSAGSVAIFK